MLGSCFHITLPTGPGVCATTWDNSPALTGPATFFLRLPVAGGRLPSPLQALGTHLHKRARDSIRLKGGGGAAKADSASQGWARCLEQRRYATSASSYYCTSRRRTGDGGENQPGEEGAGAGRKPDRRQEQLGVGRGSEPKGGRRVAVAGVCKGCPTKVAQTGWLTHQNCVVSQLWRPEIMLWAGAGAGSASPLSWASRWPPPHPCPHGTVPLSVTVS